MANVNVFEVLFVMNPTKKQAEDGAKATIVGDVVRVIAKDAQTAVMVAGRKIVELESLDPDQVEAKVRTF